MKTPMKLTLFLCALLTGCQAIPTSLAGKLPFDLPWATKAEVATQPEPESNQAATEENTEPKASVHALHEVLSLKNLQIKMNIHRRTSHLPKVSFKNMRSSEGKEWLMFYLTLSHTGSAGSGPEKRPTFTLVNPLGDEFQEDLQFMKKANADGQLQMNQILEAGQSGSTAVGFHVPRGQPYALRITEAQSGGNQLGRYLYFSLQGED